MTILNLQPAILVRYFRYLFLLLILLLFSVSVSANAGYHMVPVPLEERIEQADMVVEGEVVSQNSFWDARHERIYTSNLIKIYKHFKGSKTLQQVELITEGGSVGLTMQVVSSALTLRIGQQGIFFLKKTQISSITSANNITTTKAYAGQQGFIKYKLKLGSAQGVFDTYTSVTELYNLITSKTGSSFQETTDNLRLQEALTADQKQQQNTLLIPVITGFSPTVASAGTNTILTINGINFGNARGNGSVAFRNADDGGDTFIEPLPSDYISWSNTQIQVRIPSTGLDGGTAGSGQIRVTASDGSTITSTSTLEIIYAYTNIEHEGLTYQPILADMNMAGGYTIRFAPSMQSREAAQDGFRRAMNSWICNTNVNWHIGAPTTNEKAVIDSINVIRFASSSDVGEGVLARTISQYQGCQRGTQIVWWVDEFDMEINSEINWQYGPGPPSRLQFDFETVVLHELGHAHQLGHVIMPRVAVMHYAVERQRAYRDLSVADIEGAMLVISNSLASNKTSLIALCGTDPFIIKTDGDCNLSPDIFTFDATFTNSGTVDVIWTTENEPANLDNFVIQRSRNGTDWTEIGTVEATGPTPEGTYSFTDNNPLPGVSYYRLQVNYTNQTSSFSPRARVLNPSDMQVLSVWPSIVTPATEQINLEYIVEDKASFLLQVYNATGTLVKTLRQELTDLNTPFTLNVQGFAAGMYLIKWQEGANSGTVKIVVL